MTNEREKNAYDQLLQGVQSFVKKCVNESNRDITTTARIVSIQSDGSYNIDLNGVEYKNIDTIGGECTLNEMVRVVIPQGQYNNMFILKGGSGSGGTVTPTPSVSGVSSVNGKTGDVTLNYADVGALSSTTKIPTKTSDLENDSSYVSDSNYNHTDNNYTTDDKNSVETISNKVDKIAGKGLSTNDLTNSLKADYDDAVLKSHEHSNKSILDATTASYTIEDKKKLDNTVSNIDYNTLKGRVDTNEDSIAMLDSDVEGLTTDVGTLKTDMTAVKGVVTTIQGDYVPKTRKVNGKSLSADITLGASDVGLSNVPNVATNDQTPTFTESTTLTKLTSGEKLSVAFGKISKAITDLINHIANKNNPHKVTKTQVGLGNVGNFKAVSTVASQGLTDTEKANARANIGAGTSSFSGSYNDLTNKPTIPTNTNQLTNGAGFITSSGTAKTISDTLPISKGGTGKTTGADAANTLINSLSTGESTPTDADYYISQYVGGGTTRTSYHRRPMSALWNYIKSKLATVATSGSYNDLSNKPTIPSVGNGTITIKQNGTTKGTFTTNQSGNTTIELTDDNTTYNDATQSSSGLMSSTDKKKLDNIDSYATNIPFVIGTQTAATGTWTGATSELSSLVDGQTIRYWLPYNGSGNATLNLTLSNGNTTGAINCYWKGTSRLTTHYAAGTVITLTYRKSVAIGGSGSYTGWWSDADVDSDSYYRLRYQQPIKCGTTAIVANNIIVGNNGLYEHLKLGKAFDITYPILYAGSAISANRTGTNNYVYYPLTITTTQSITLTAYKPIFIKGNLSGTIFTPISIAPLTQTVPKSADGYEYILLGVAYNTKSVYLLSEHPIFAYKGGAFGQISSKGITDLSIDLNIMTYTRADGTTGTIDLSSVSKLVWNGETTIVWNE